MSVLAIDPGNTRSAFVVVGPDGRTIRDHGILANEEMLALVLRPVPPASELAIEMVQGFGKPVGFEVFETVFWIGRFVQAWDGPWTRIYRKEVKRHLCGSDRAKDPNVRQAILDLYYPGNGGGSRPQIGTKSQPGPLYGVSADVWSALAVAITFCDRKQAAA